MSCTERDCLGQLGQRLCRQVVSLKSDFHQMQNALSMKAVAISEEMEQSVDDFVKTCIRQSAIRQVELESWVNGFLFSLCTRLCKKVLLLCSKLEPDGSFWWW